MTSTSATIRPAVRLGGGVTALVAGALSGGVDVLLAGLRVVEVPCELHHRVSGSDWRGQLHRARQYRDVALALVHRRLRRVAG